MTDIGQYKTYSNTCMKISRTKSRLAEKQSLSSRLPVVKKKEINKTVITQRMNILLVRTLLVQNILRK